MFQNAGNRRRETKERTDEMEQKKEIRIGGEKLARARSEEKKDVGKEGDDSERMGRDLRKHTATIDRNKERRRRGERNLGRTRWIKLRRKPGGKIEWLKRVETKSRKVQAGEEIRKKSKYGVT